MLGHRPASFQCVRTHASSGEAPKLPSALPRIARSRAIQESTGTTTMTRDAPAMEVRCCTVEELRRAKRETDWRAAENFFDMAPNETILDTCTLAVCAVDKDTGKVAGFVALSAEMASARSEESDAVLEWIAGECGALGFDPRHTLWVTACSLAGGAAEGEAALRCMFRFAFRTLLGIQSIGLAASAHAAVSHGALASLLPKLAASSTELATTLGFCERSAVCGALSVRQARVEDHDDLTPVVEAMRQGYPDLAHLPASVKPAEKFALARLIECEDWKVLVATDGPDGPIVGMMCLQELEDVSALQRDFDLEVYDNLVRTSEVEMVVTEEEGVASPSQAQPKDGEEPDAKGSPGDAAPDAADAGSDAASPAAEEGAEAMPSEGAEEEETTADGEGSAPEDAANGGSGMGSPGETHSSDGEGGEGGEDDDEEEGEGSDDKADENAAKTPVTATAVEQESVAFAITMFCMKDDFSEQALDFMQFAFEMFPTRDYCVVSLSHTSRIPSILSSFSQAMPTPEKLSSNVLYLLHRYSLLTDFSTSMATVEDYNEILDFLGDLAEVTSVVAALNKAIDEATCIKAVCQDQIVGVCSVALDVKARDLMLAFELDAFSDGCQYRNYAFARVTTFVMNPVFAHQKRYFFSRVMSAFEKNALCFKMKQDEPIMDVLDVFEPVSQRRAKKGKGGEDAAGGKVDFSLFVLSQRDVFREKIVLNSRIVIVGASTCGLSCLHRLCVNASYAYTNLTLVTPDQTAGSRDMLELTQKLAFLSQVRIITSPMVEVDRELRQLYLGDDTVVPYEVLVLTCGIEDQLDFGMDSEKKSILSVSQLANALNQREADGETATKQSVIVYGGRIEAYDAIRILEERGVPYKFIAPELFQKAVLVKNIAAEAGIDVPTPLSMVLTSIAEEDDGSDALKCSFINEGGEIADLECSLLVLADKQNVNQHIFNCMNDSSIVYDGRLVVDGNFRTTDEFIFGGGTLAKFSRKFGEVLLEKYNSVEAGSLLADNITDWCRERQGLSREATKSGDIPDFEKPVSIGIQLPSNQHHLTYISRPPLDEVTMKTPQGGRVFKTMHEGQLSILALDKNNVICLLCFCGPKEAKADAFTGLIGLHLNYLNQMLEKIDSIACIHAYLTQVWCDALYSEMVLSLRQKLLNNVKSRTKAITNTALFTLVQDGLLDVIKENKASFPRYKVPYSS